MSALAGWWARRQARERQFLGLGTVGVALLFAWLFGIEPLAARVEAAGRQLAAEHATGAWLAAIAPAAAEGSTPSALADGETALGVLNESLRASGLDTRLKRLAPGSDATFELGFEGAGWQPLAAWLQHLSEARGVRVTAAHLEKTAQPGMVNATLSLKFAGASNSAP